MVGIVLVSHSARLAEGVAELIGQVAGDEVPIHPAGGGPDGELGTDPDRIEAAIERADQGEGVLVLVDVGSAVLSVKGIVAEQDAGDRIRIADAPLVEGALSAAVMVAAGAGLDDAVASAEGARDVRKL